LTLCLHLLISASNLGRSFFFHLSPIPWIIIKEGFKKNQVYEQEL
jgi:hypothetical protein